jgi:hypothetical protein
LGKNGIQGQKDIGGSGNPVIEGDGGAGTARGHWDEETYQNELMTGFLSGKTQPMSKLTVQSLKDIGYTVDVTKADNFLIPGGVAVTKAPVTATKAPTKAPVTKAPTSAGATNAPTTAANNGFQIQLVFTTTMSTAQQNAFIAAAAKWQSVIVGDIGATVRVAQGTSICGQPPQAADLLIDDILIFAAISNIDGVGKILGQAGPCAFDQANRVRLGSMQFDAADVAQLEAQGTLTATILHEMGHVIGIGTQWENGLVSNTAIAGSTSFPYLGANGIQGQKDIGGAGNPVVEGDGGPGTARGHWDEQTYQNELMTGFLSGKTQPMSKLTVEALKDLGYVVDVNQADAFTIPAAGRRLRSLQDEPTTQWESGWNGEMVWDLFPLSKSLELGEDDWEIPYQGAVTDNLVAIPKGDDAGAIAGGVVGALAVVGAAAFVVIRRRKNSLTTNPHNSIAASGNPMFQQQLQQQQQQQQQQYYGNQQQHQQQYYQ